MFLLSCRGTQRQLGYGSSPGVSVLGKMNRVVYSQAHVSTVAPDYTTLLFFQKHTTLPFKNFFWKKSVV